MANRLHCSSTSHRRQSAPRSGSTLTLVFFTLLIVGAGASVGAYWLMQMANEASPDLLMHTVQYGSFDHDVVERGEIESSRNVEIRCEVKSQNTTGTAILEVVDEGTRVQPGDVLVRLDSSALDLSSVEQQILRNTSEALMIQAHNTMEAGKIAKKEYLEGTYEQTKQTIESELFVAEENLRRAKEYALYSERLAAKGYVTTLQLEGDQFAVEKFRNELDTARTKLRVLQEYTKEKMLMEFDSAIKTAEAQWKAEQSSHKLELTKLKDIEDQIARCVIRAPQAGTVVYANQQSSRSQNEFIVEPGALVRERQVIVRLPDPQQMQVKAEINESRITLVKAGMKATIRLDAFEDAVLYGVVTRVNEYPEPSSWFSSQIKEYATLVEISDPPPILRPGLTAEVRIHVEHLDNALQVPVQAIHAHGGRLYSMVETGNGWEARGVTIGSSNEKFVLIESGLREGERVAMSPRRLLDRVTLPELPDAKTQLASSDGSPRGGFGAGAGTADGGDPMGPDAMNPSAVAGMILSRLDQNSDGMLTSNEIPIEESQRLADADTNGDGAVEHAELMAAVNRQFRQRGPRPEGGGPADGVNP